MVKDVDHDDRAAVDPEDPPLRRLEPRVDREQAVADVEDAAARRHGAGQLVEGADGVARPGVETRPAAGALRTWLAVALAALTGCSHPESALGVVGSASDGLVFVRLSGDASDLARARLSDGSTRPFIETPEREERWPYWSTQARRLAFQVRPLDENEFDLMLWDPDTREETALTRTPGRDERWPEWAPDGSRLVHAFRGGDPPSGVALADPHGRATQILAAAGRRDFFLRPTFSPDGARLVAQRRGSDGVGSKLWILERGQSPRALTRDPHWVDQKARFTPDGAWILYSQRRPGQPRDLVLLRPDGAERRLLTETPEVDEHSARFAPGRDEIVFVSDRDGSADIFLLDPRTGATRNLTASPELDELAPRWSPDGERIAVSAVPADPGKRFRDSGTSVPQMRVMVLDRQGRVLLDTPGHMPDWMPPWP